LTCIIDQERRIKGMATKEGVTTPQESPGQAPPSFIEPVENEAPTNSELGEISSLAEQQIKLEEEIAELNAQVAQKSADLLKICENALPEAMARINMKKFSMMDGRAIEIKESVFASIRKDRMVSAVAWLDKNGLGDVVKDEITVNLSRGQMAEAQVVMAFVQERNLAVMEKLSVNAMTLKSLVAEQRKKGVAFPEEDFSIYDKRVSVIKAAPKTK
jgi:hypothetical protein